MNKNHNLYRLLKTLEDNGQIGAPGLPSHMFSEVEDKMMLHVELSRKYPKYYRPKKSDPKTYIIKASAPKGSGWEDIILDDLIKQITEMAQDHVGGASTGQEQEARLRKECVELALYHPNGDMSPLDYSDHLYKYITTGKKPT